MKLDDFKYDSASGLHFSSERGTPAGYMDGAESYLVNVLNKSDDLGVFSQELKSNIRDWPSLYHLSPYRTTLFDCLDFHNPDLSVLELGAGCGAVTRWLGENFSKVYAVEGNVHRAHVAGLRCRDLSGVKIYSANFLDLTMSNMFDMATLIGVLEYSHLYHPTYKNSPSKAALSTLQMAFKSLNERGVLVLAIENKFGLKYFSGAGEDHSGKIFDGIQGYPNKNSAVTFSAHEIKELLRSAGFSDIDFYLPFPDYKLPNTIINGQKLDPKYYLHNWIDTPFPDRCGNQRTLLFNESLVLRGLHHGSMLRDMANSFFIVAYKGERKEVDRHLQLPKQEWIAKHYSLDRYDTFRKKVTLIPDSSDALTVVNSPVSAKKKTASDQGAPFSHSFPSEKYCPGDQLIFTFFEFLSTEEFEKRLLNLIGSLNRFLLDNYATGEKDNEGIPLIKGDAIDVALWNIIVEEGTGNWKAIDREWSYNGMLPVDFVLWRNLYHLILRYKSYFKESFTDETTRQFIFICIRTLYPEFDDVRYRKAKLMEEYFQKFAQLGSVPDRSQILPLGKPLVSWDENVPLTTSAGNKNEKNISCVEGVAEMEHSAITHKVSIIIPVFNKVNYTKQCLEALAANTLYKPYEVIIVDDNSTDGTREYLKNNLSGDLRIITNETNLGFAKSCNRGAKAASGEFLVFLNNDTVPDKGWLSSMISSIKRNPEAAVVGSKLLYPDGTIQHAGVVFGRDKETVRLYHIYRGINHDHPSVNREREFNMVTGACMLVERDVFFGSGMFDENYLNGYEDIDLCLKVREAGKKVIYSPGSRLIHFEGKSEGRHLHDDRNAAYFMSKWQNRIIYDDYIKASEDGFSIQYRPDGMINVMPIDELEGTDRLIAEALRSQARQDHAGVISACEKTLKLDEMNRKALRMMGEAKVELGLIEEAESLYLKLVSIEDSIENILLLTEIELKLGKTHERLQWLEGISGKDYRRHEHKINILLGECYKGMSRYGEAIERFQKAIELRENDERAYACLGEIALALGKQEDARSLFNEALTLKKGYGRAINGLEMIDEMNCENIRSGPDEKTGTEKGSDNSADILKKKIALVRGGNLNKWETQNYEHLADRYDITAFATTEGHFETDGIGFPVERLDYKSSGLTLYMEGLEERLAGHDLIFTADITYLFSLQAVKAKEKHGGKVVCLEWENIPFIHDNINAVREIKKRVIKGADHFIAVTERAKEALILEGAEKERIEVINIGIDLKRFRPDKEDRRVYRKTLGLEEDETVVLFIGRMDREKGVYDFIDAAKRILDSDKTKARPVKFIMAGNGCELEELRNRIIDLGIWDSMSLIEESTYKDIHRLHNMADIFVLPSISTPDWEEQYGMVLIESMACAKPVIGTLSGSIPEVVGDAGLLVPENDCISLSDAITNLILDDQLRTEYGNRALERVRNKYDSRKTAEKIEAVFDKVLNAPEKEIKYFSGSKVVQSMSCRSSE